jgi:hypothetical protein
LRPVIIAEIFTRQGAPPVSLIPVVHLDLRISPRIFKKIEMTLMVIFRDLGEDDSRKKMKKKIL